MKRKIIMTTYRKMLLTTALICGLVSFIQAADTGNQQMNLDPTKQARIKVTDRAWPAKYGEADICLWKNDKLVAFSVTIDDNNVPDHEYWLALGDKYGWKWTWFVIVNRIKDRPNHYGTWADFQKIADKGHDIQSHAFSHRDKKLNIPIDKDYADAATEINKNIKNNRCLTMAYPGGALPNDPNVGRKYYIGCRWVVGHQNRADKVNYIKTNSIGNFAGFFEAEKHWASFAGMLNPSNNRKFRNWYCTHFHGMSNAYAVKKKIKEHTEKVLDELKKNEKDVWVGTFREVIQYGQERDTARIKDLKVAPGKISLAVTDKMHDEFFDMPLTIKVRLENDWSKVAATQNGEAIDAKLIEHDGAKYALVNVVPDRGVVVIIE
jgi:Polysaccharide deacetylase